MTAYELRISDGSSDVCSSDLRVDAGALAFAVAVAARHARRLVRAGARIAALGAGGDGREVVELRAAQQRIGAVVAGQRDAQVVVGGQFLLEQRSQLRVDASLPERRVGVCGGAGARGYGVRRRGSGEGTLARTLGAQERGTE